MDTVPLNKQRVTYTLNMAGKVPVSKMLFTVELSASVWLWSARVVCFSVGIVIPCEKSTFHRFGSDGLARLGESLSTPCLSTRHVWKHTPQ